MAEADSLADRVDDLLDRARDRVEALADSESPDEARETLADLLEIADEAEDVLEEIDLAELIEVIDADDVADAVDFDDIPEAVEEGDAGEAIHLRRLVDLTELPTLLDDVNTRALWRELRELDDATDDLNDEDGGEDDGLLDVDADDVTPDDGFDADDVEPLSVGDEEEGIDQEMLETAVQSKVSGAVEEFREGLVAAHHRLADLREYNEERTRQTGHPQSRNPTAVSTLSSGRSDMGTVANHSTVPRETRHSTAPNQERIYGSRFERDEEEDDDA